MATHHDNAIKRWHYTLHIPKKGEHQSFAHLLGRNAPDQTIMMFCFTNRSFDGCWNLPLFICCGRLCFGRI